MKTIAHAILIALLLCLPTSLCAADQISVTTKFLESSKVAIPHNLAKASKMKGIDMLTGPKIITKPGKQAKMEILREHQPVSVAPSTFKPSPVGVTIHVTPHIKGDKITYTARFTIAQVIKNNSPKGQPISEVSSRDLYVSGTSKNGEDVWLDFIDPNNAKKLTVLINFSIK